MRALPTCNASLVATETLCLAAHDGLTHPVGMDVALPRSRRLHLLDRASTAADTNALLAIGHEIVRT